MTLAERIEKESSKARGIAENCETVARHLQPEMDRFDARTPPWNTYAVRMAVDHRQSANRERALSEDLAIAAAIVRAAGDRP